MGGVTPASGIPVDPLQPMLRAVTCNQILQTIGRRDSPRFSSTEKVLSDWVRIVAENTLGGHREQGDKT